MNYYEKLKSKLPSLEDEVFCHKLENHVYQYYLAMHYAFISFVIVFLIACILVIFKQCSYVYVIYAIIGAIICAALKMMFRYVISKLQACHGNEVILNILSSQANAEIEILYAAVKNNELLVAPNDIWKYYNTHPDDIDDSSLERKTIENFINNNECIQTLRKKDHTDEIQHHIRAENARIERLGSDVSA